MEANKTICLRLVLSVASLIIGFPVEASPFETAEIKCRIRTPPPVLSPSVFSTITGRITHLGPPPKQPSGDFWREITVNYNWKCRICDFSQLFLVSSDGTRKSVHPDFVSGELINKYEVKIHYDRNLTDEGTIIISELFMMEPGPIKGQIANTLKGRVWSQWADNPDSEILFGIQYWNTGEPASGEGGGRSSTQMEVKPPDPLFTCCGWGFTGGTEKNNPYSGWYHAATTVRLAVKDKTLMDQIIKASQDLVAIEVTLDGRTITDFKVLK